MRGIGRRVTAAAAALGFAALSVAVGVRLSNADEPKAPDLGELREAVQAAGKRGDNVSEVLKALDALEKALAKGVAAPVPGRPVPAPPELTALRDAVEAAGRKGENVNEIRKQLEAVEKAITGQVLAKPKPLPPPEPADPPARPEPGRFPGRVRPDVFPQGIPLPDLGGLGGGGINPADIQKAQDLMRKAIEMRMRNRDDAEALRMLEEAREMMMKALQGGAGGGLALPNAGGLVIPDLNGLNGLDLAFPNAGGRANEKFRLGVRLERLTPITMEHLKLSGQGVVIAEVVEGTVAEKVGFKPNDIVIEFGGKPVTDAPEDFTRQVGNVKAGEKVDAVLLRKGDKVELKGIELPAAPVAPNPPRGRDVRPQPIPELKPLPRIEVKPLPVPEIKPLTLPVPDADGAIRVLPGNSVSVVNRNGEFVVKASQDGVSYLLTGRTEDGTPKLESVTIDDGGQVTKADALEKVPEAHRETVESLLKANTVRVKGRR